MMRFGVFLLVAGNVDKRKNNRFIFMCGESTDMW